MREEIIALNSWTLGQAPPPELIDVARRAGYRAIELRAVDFQSGSDPQHDAELVRRSGLSIASLGTDGILVQASAAEQRDWFARLEQTVLLATSIGCDTLMVSTGMQNATTVDEAAALLAEAADVAAASGLRMAYEFNAFHPSIASLPDGLAVVDKAGRQNAGLALDAYHLQRSRGFDRLADIEPGRLFCVQISDVPAGQSEPPLDRLVPGDGIIAWRRLFEFLDEIAYGGFVAFEAPNPAHWKGDPVALSRRAREAIGRLWQAGKTGGTDVQR